MARKQTALALAVAAIALAAIAVIGYLGSRPIAGPVDSVEGSLAGETSTTTTSGHAAPLTTLPVATWAINEKTDLSELQTAQAPAPSHVTIDALDVDAPVGAYGVDDAGLMDVPDNVTEVAWYRHGPSPGEAGSAVLAAHVDLRGQGPGVFFELDQLSIGDRIVVSYRDGSSLDFRVVAHSIYRKDELPLDAIFSRTGSPVLTLVTCGGVFSQTTSSYDSNVVVYAVPSDLARPDSGRR